MFRLVMLAALSSLLPACASLTPQSEDFAQRYLDAETGLPIEGVFVSVTWLKDIPRKVGSECVQHAVLRSGPDGWVRQKAPDDPEAYHLFPNLLAPGYEYFVFVVDSVQGDKMKVRHRLDYSEMSRRFYPGWAADIERRGYVVNGSYYEKTFVIDNYGDERNRPRYLIKRMSFPNQSSGSAMTMIRGGVCEDKDRNIGAEFYAEAQLLQKRESALVLCDPRWDKALNVPELFIPMAIQYLDPSSQEKSMEIFKRNFPNYSSQDQKPFAASERELFCRLAGLESR
jgi:hypothetical protein